MRYGPSRVRRAGVAFAATQTRVGVDEIGG
jgi:hypothetical protein